MRDMLVVVPSRGRPGNIERLHRAMLQTCSLDTQLVVGLDTDDEHSYPRLNGVEYEVRDGLHYVTGWNNELVKGRLENYEIVAAGLGDDNLPRTQDWDVSVKEALEEQPFAFTNDLYPRVPGSLSCHMFMRREVVEKLGYVGPPQIAHMYVDVAWMAWGLACGVKYLHEVIVEHMHFTIGKAHNDSTYNGSQSLIPPDLANWHAYSRGGQLNADIEKLGGTPYTPESLQKFNTDLFIPG